MLFFYNFVLLNTIQYLLQSAINTKITGVLLVTRMTNLPLLFHSLAVSLDLIDILNKKKSILLFHKNG